MSLKQFSSVISDTTFVLTKLDKQNQKALWRRGYANKSAAKYEDANRDFMEYQKLYGKDADMAKALTESMKLMVEEQKSKKEEAKKREEEAKNRPKIQEVDPPAFKKVKIDEDSDDSDDEAERMKI